MVTKVETFS